MPKALLCLGSNHQQARHMALASRALAQLAGTATFSPALWSLPVGTAPSPLYLNSLVQLDTPLALEELRAATKDIERALGRRRDPEALYQVSIDIDILQYDGKRYKPEDWERSYVKALLKHIIPKNPTHNEE